MNLVEDQLSQIERIASSRILQLDVEGLVRMLTPIGDFESEIEFSRAENEQFIAKQLLQIQSAVNRYSQVPRTAAHPT